MATRKTAAKPATRKRKTPTPPAGWGPAQEAALEYFRRAVVNGVTFDTETTGLLNDAEIWEIAVTDIASGECLLETLVRPQQTPDMWEPVAWQMAQDGGVTWEMLKNAPDWRAEVWPALQRVTANRGVYAWSGEPAGEIAFDRRLVSQTCEMHGLPALGMLDFPLENFKSHHLALRQAEWKARGGRRTLEHAIDLEGLKFPGKAHRARVDADAEAQLIRHVVQPTEADQCAAVRSDLNLLRRLRLQGRVKPDDVVTFDGAQTTRQLADIRRYTILGDTAAGQGKQALATLYYDFVGEVRSGMYAPVPDFDARFTFGDKPKPGDEPKPIAIGDYVRMAQNVIWRYGKVAKVVDVLGREPLVRYKVEFLDGAILTYHDNCIGERVARKVAESEGWK